MQNVDRRCRVDTLNAKRVCIVVDFADENALALVGRQLVGDLVHRVYNADIELRRPVSVRLTRNDMPVVMRLVIN